MNKRSLVLILLLVAIFGSGSIVIVWMRMDISKVAKHCGELEDEREIVSREVQELRGQRSRALRPSTLAAMVMGRLAMPDPSRTCLLYTSPSPRDRQKSRMPSSA